MSPGQIIGQSILGKERFIDCVKARFLAKGPDREMMGIRQIKGYKARQNIFKALKQETGKTEKELQAEKGDLRRLVMELLYKVGGLNGVKIGKIFNISYNAVSQERKRVRERMKGDPKLNKIYRALLHRLE